MRIKQLWKGIFSFPVGLVREYAYAYTEKQARILMVNRIAKRQGVDGGDADSHCHGETELLIICSTGSTHE